MSISEETKKSVEIFSKANDAFFDDDYDEALNLFSQLVIREPGNVEFLLKRCSVYQKIDKLDLALRDAETALRLIKEDSHTLLARAHLQTGITLHRLAQYKKAQEHLEKSKELNATEKTLIAWLKKNTEKLREIEPAEIPKEAPTQDNTLKKPARHEWFQNENFITIEVFVKKVKQEDTTVDIFENSISFAVKLPTGSTYSIELDPLAHKIIPEESTFKILTTKIEIKLKKEICGIMWNKLEVDNDLEIKPSSTAYGPAHGWKNIPDDDDEPEGEAGVNYLFQKIYRDADPNTKRAMMKSFVESNGTCLSTNWSDVGSKKMETKPPEGTTVKKFT